MKILDIKDHNVMHHTLIFTLSINFYSFAHVHAPGLFHICGALNRKSLFQRGLGLGLVSFYLVHR